MRKLFCWCLTGVLFVLSSVDAQPIPPLGASHANCQNGCRNADADALYPKGSKDVDCVKSCKWVRPAHLYEPPSPGVRPSGNNRAFVLLEPLVYQIGTTDVRIVVPAGFVTDYASIPRPLWSIYSPHDQYSRAAIVHDYLYWTRACTRLQADNLFMIAMKESEVPMTTRNDVYLGVRAGGESSWKKNEEERVAGLPKVVPVGRNDFPPNWSWEMYRKYLVLQGVKDPSFVAPSYCSFGNTTDVPFGKGVSTAKSATYHKSLVERAREGNDEVVFMRGVE